MLHLTNQPPESVFGTCVVCYEKVAASGFYRCSNQVCGGKEGSGRVCSECWFEMMQHSPNNQCPTCKRTPFNNPISDLDLLLPLFEQWDPPPEVIYESVINLFNQGHSLDTLLERVPEYAHHVLHATAHKIVTGWYEFAPEVFERLCDRLKDVLLLKQTILGWSPIFKAVAKRSPRVLAMTVKWTKWLEAHPVIRYAEGITEIEAENEVELLCACRSIEEFIVFRQLALGKYAPVQKDRFRLSVLDQFFTRYPEERPEDEWVLDELLSGKYAKSEITGRRGIGTKFPNDKLYQWMSQHQAIICFAVSNPSAVKKYPIVPVLYCHNKKGLYHQLASGELIDTCQHTSFFVSDVFSENILYLDLENDGLCQNWPEVEDVLPVDAHGAPLRMIRSIDNSVEIYLGANPDEATLLVQRDPARRVKIYNFSAFKFELKNTCKRKIQLVE